MNNSYGNRSQPGSEREPIGRPVPSARFAELSRMSRRELEATFLRGSPPNLDRLVGWEFRGLNLPPRLAQLAGVRKFIKGFTRREDDQVFGYNTPVAQNRA